MLKAVVAVFAVLSCLFLLMEGMHFIRLQAETVFARRREKKPYRFAVCSMLFVCCVVFGALGDHVLLVMHDLQGFVDLLTVA